MQIFDSSDDKSLSLIVIQHGELPPIHFPCNLTKPSKLVSDRIFPHINGYFNSLHKNTQEEIYWCYSRIRKIFDTHYSELTKTPALKKEIKKLYKYTGYEAISRWCRLYGDIKIPTSIKDSYKDMMIAQRNSGEQYINKTYIKDDYVELTHLAVLLRLFVPIWGMYLDRSGVDVVNKIHKEVDCIDLLSMTEILSLPPVKRLANFINDSIEYNANTMSSVLGGMSSDKIPEWLQCLVMCRKLSIVEVSSVDDTNKLVSVVYSTLRYTLKSIEKRFVGRVKKKLKPNKEESDISEGGDKSLMEIYKVKEARPAVDYLYANYYVSDINRVIGIMLTGDVRTKYTLPPEEYQELNEIVNRLQAEDWAPEQCQVSIMTWLYHPVMNPGSMDTIDYAGTLKLAAAAHYILTKWGLVDLAAIITGTGNYILLDDNTYLPSGGTDVRGRVNKELQRQLDVYYPHPMIKGGKIVEEINVAVRDIDSIVPSIMKCSWKTNMTLHASKHVKLNTEGSYVVQVAVKDQLAVMLIKVNELNEHLLDLEG